MRDGLFISITLALVAAVVLWLVPWMGFSIAPKALWWLAGGAALFAGLLVLLGESIVEDGIKVGFMLACAGVLWLSDARLAVFFVIVLLSGAAGMAMNQLNRFTARRARTMVETRR
ncbi:hypothetical protein HUS23_07975 [Ectothiorhodospiraceae bacterium 2226]|nr:hypothetical protein HUS23_07975 [Ectothiorhodospiraceae bacterium 2226]